MKEKPRDPILTTIESLKLDKISPDEGTLDEVLSIKSYELSSLSLEELSKCIHALSQYGFFLQGQANIRQIKFSRAKKAFEVEEAKHMIKASGKTVKEKTNNALAESEKLQELQKTMHEAEEQFIILNKLPERIEDLINAFKKEQAIRSERF